MEAIISAGDVIQADPAACRWGPVLVIVTEVKSWGVMGYFFVVNSEGDAAPAYIRIAHNAYARIGTARWLLETTDAT